MKKCANIPLLLKKLVDNVDDVPFRKKDGYAYTKRSMELMQDGHTGSVVFDSAGNIAGAASYYEKGGKLWVETLGSIGPREKRTTPGMSLLYDTFKQADGKDVRLHSLPGRAAEFYQDFEFKPLNVADELDLTAKSEDYVRFMKWYEDENGI